MNLTNFIPAVLAILGIKEFHQEEGRKVLTAKQKKKLAESGFPDKFAEDFETALNEPEASEPEASTRVAALSAVLGQVTSQLQSANAELARLRAQNSTTSSTLAEKEATIADLESKVVTLSQLAEPDNAPNAALSSATGSTFDLANDKQLGGFEGAMFALDRPYNQRARAAIAARRGMSIMTAIPSTADFSTLKEDLGAFYRQPWREKIQSFLTTLTSVESIWPL